MHCVLMQMPSAVDLFQSCINYLNLKGISKMFVMNRNNPWKAAIEGSSSKQSLKYRLCPSHISSPNYAVLIERKLLLNCCCQFSIAEEASQAVNRLPSSTKAMSPVISAIYSLQCPASPQPKVTTTRAHTYRSMNLRRVCLCQITWSTEGCDSADFWNFKNLRS